MQASSRHLIFHGAIVMVFGLLLGAPYARAINRGVAAHVVNSWRIAHASLPLAATLMFAVAAVMPSFAVSSRVCWVIAIAHIVSSYAFCVSMPLAAITGQRGLTSASFGLGKLVYVGNIVGAWTSMIAAGVFLYAAFVSL